MIGISNFKNIVTGDIAIDLGTANTLIWIKGQGIILNEPSIVARNVVNGDIIAVGNEAMEMVGRTHSGIETLRPLKDGVIADYKMTDAMILGFIRKIKLSRIARPRIVICIPSGVTDVEQRSVKESAEHANASEVYLIEEPMAAAIGIGIDVSKPVGNMIVDVGGGTTEIAVISLNGIGTIETIRIAGDEQTKAIIDWFKDQHKSQCHEGIHDPCHQPANHHFKKESGRVCHIKKRRNEDGIQNVHFFIPLIRCPCMILNQSKRPSRHQ